MENSGRHWDSPKEKRDLFENQRSFVSERHELLCKPSLLAIPSKVCDK